MPFQTKRRERIAKATERYPRTYNPIARRRIGKGGALPPGGFKRLPSFGRPKPAMQEARQERVQLPNLGRATRGRGAPIGKRIKAFERQKTRLPFLPQGRGSTGTGILYSRRKGREGRNPQVGRRRVAQSERQYLGAEASRHLGSGTRTFRRMTPMKTPRLRRRKTYSRLFTKAAGAPPGAHGPIGR